MKSYDEIYRNVLRRRDEQLAKKRRRISVASSVVLPAIMLTAAGAAAAVALWGRQPEEGYVYDTGSLAPGSTLQQTLDNTELPVQLMDNTEPPIQLMDNRLILTENGENIDITDEISEDAPYIYEYVDARTGMVRYAVVGGTPENYGWARFVMYEWDSKTPEFSKWNNYSCNTFAAYNQDRNWYGAAISQLGEKPENLGICVWSMTERAWELVSLEDTVNTVAAQDSLDGYTAILELIGVTHEPAAGENYYTAERAVLTVNDPEGNTANISLNSIDTMNQNVRGKWDTDENGNVKSRVKLWAMDYKGEKRYMVSVGLYRAPTFEYIDKYGNYDDEPTYGTVFFGFDSEVFETGRLRPYGESIYGDSISFGLSDSFRFDNGTTFVEDGNGNGIDFFVVFNPDSYDVTDSFELDNHPVHGNPRYGYSVGLTLYDLTHLPKFDSEDYYAAEDAKLYINAINGQAGAEIYLSQCETAGLFDEFAKNLNASHEEDCVTLMKLKEGGKEHYIIMLRNYHGDNYQPYYRTAFFEFDPESHMLTPYEYDDHCLVVTTPIVEIESKDGTDVLVTERSDINEFPNENSVNTWDYVTACCNKVIWFDHENHILNILNLTIDLVE